MSAPNEGRCRNQPFFAINGKTRTFFDACFDDGDFWQAIKINVDKARCDIFETRLSGKSAVALPIAKPHFKRTVFNGIARIP